MNRSILVMALLLVLAAPVLNHAGPKDRPGDMLFKKMKLTEQQMDKVEALRLSHQKVMIDLKAEMQKAKLAMKETLLKDEMSKSDFTAQSDKIAAVHEKIRKERESHMMAIYDVLDASQKKMWRKFHAEKGPRMEKRFKHRMHRGFGPYHPGQGPGPNIDED